MTRIIKIKLILKDICIFAFAFVEHTYLLISVCKMNYHTDIVILLFRGALFKEGRLSESGRSLDHLRY